ncbi:MAG: Mur ligase domain-containing protein [Planctomycetota bacterium]
MSPNPSPDPLSKEEIATLLGRGRAHFVGVAGAGMSALAEYRRLAGGATSGSDRFFDRGVQLEERDRLARLGVEILPQDGRGVEGASCVVASTAVEAAIPDLARARELGVPVLHRSELLARHVDEGTTLAVTGTSGKSTVVGLAHSALAAAGADPGVITGGELLALRRGDHRGNAGRGRGPLVIEADESDRSLDRYAPDLGLILNLQRDHLPEDELRALFDRFADRCARLVVAEDEALASLHDRGLVFGFGPRAAFRAHHDADRGILRVEDLEIRLPQPGRHTAFNALAALAAVRALGEDLGAAARGIEGFRGIHRRFEVLGRPGGVQVIDDFAHNPAKIAAALEALGRSRGRAFALFQPHGFAPTKFYREELVEALATGLADDDVLILRPIYYAGGSAVKDIASEDLVADLAARGRSAVVLGDPGEIGRFLAERARPGDVVLSMGARDPELHGFARGLARALSGDAAESSC